ncbi:LOW QUALITY PROTEIN: hypothetical protein BC938DRAFT_477838 [Jimgerdemannia flammicorona]|uniref:Uncharacterized protein n=1 Tax=Jimgerdemannia flammicorona TaxID=994334 RepID=A0A433QNS5_9FUNG|nr:LOW QUALITY PROTEIN: hypothetical protein BC938DRAFT_477838 [Jimgerdemannia flammicorona]
MATFHGSSAVLDVHTLNDTVYVVIIGLLAVRNYQLNNLALRLYFHRAVLHLSPIPSSTHSLFSTSGLTASTSISRVAVPDSLEITSTTASTATPQTSPPSRSPFSALTPSYFTSAIAVATTNPFPISSTVLNKPASIFLAISSSRGTLVSPNRRYLPKDFSTSASICSLSRSRPPRPRPLPPVAEIPTPRVWIPRARPLLSVAEIPIPRVWTPRARIPLPALLVPPLLVPPLLVPPPLALAPLVPALLVPPPLAPAPLVLPQLVPAPLVPASLVLAPLVSASLVPASLVPASLVPAPLVPEPRVPTLHRRGPRHLQDQRPATLHSLPSSSPFSLAQGSLSVSDSQLYRTSSALPPSRVRLPNPTCPRSSDSSSWSLTAWAP